MRKAYGFPSSFYIWIHSRPQLITALSEGRGYGEAGGEGLFPGCQISDFLTHPFTCLLSHLQRTLQPDILR